MISKKYTLYEILIVHDVDDSTPTTQRISIHGTKKSLRDCLKQIFWFLLKRFHQECPMQSKV